MLIDVVQEKTFVKASYVNDNGDIAIENLPLPEDGYTKWTICDDDDPDASKEFKNYDGQSVKRVPAYKFDDLNLTEFLTKQVAPELRKKIFAFHKPKGFSVDIETEITDDAMPQADTAPNKILSIQITAPNMATIVLLLKKANEENVQKIIDESPVGQYCKKHGIKLPWKQLLFDNEREMLIFFLQMVNRSWHLIYGWNFLRYDWKYIYNRCVRLNIPFEKLVSPEGKVEGNDKIPVHRLVIDYMEAYKAGSRGNSALLSYSLNSVADFELGLAKIEYPLTLKELYAQDYDRFIAYAIVDPILVQLIHKKTNKIDVMFNMAYYTKVPFKASDGNIAQTDALQFEEMYNSGKVYADVRGDTKSKEKYDGAFVKPPVYSECDFPAAWDAKSLYPSTIRAYNISPENYIGQCKESEVEKLRAKGFFVSDKRSVYRNDEPGSFKRLESRLADERTIYKTAMLEIWDNMMPILEAEAKKRGIDLH